MRLEKDPNFKVFAKRVFLFGMLFAVIMPPVIYFHKEKGMRQMEKGLYDDYERVKSKGKSYSDINNIN